MGPLMTAAATKAAGELFAKSQEAGKQTQQTGAPAPTLGQKVAASAIKPEIVPMVQPQISWADLFRSRGLIK